MTNALKVVVDELKQLPEADQVEIGRHVLDHVAKLRALRADIDAGIRSLNAGQGRAIDMRDVISRARNAHDRRER